MASASNSKTLYNNNGNGFTLTASFNENSTSTANNTSNITCTATFSSSNANWQTGYPSTLTIYWHDNRENYDRQVASINFSGIGQWDSRTASGTINVTHKDDGTLSGYAYAYFSKGSTTTSWACNSGGVTTSWTALTTIARASQPSINTWPQNSPDFNIGDTITIHMNRKSTAFTHTVTLYFGNYSYQIATGVTDNCKLNTSTIANKLYQQIPNASVGEGNITVKTYNGSTLVGTKSCLFYAHVVNSNPTFNTSYLDTNSTTTAITGNNQQIIRNNSTLQVKVTSASAKNYATLNKATCVINGTTYNASFSGSNATFNIGKLNVSSNTTAKVTVIDSRGISTSKTLTITVLDWVLPTAIISLQRQNNFYSETDINVNAEYSNLDNKNTITIKIREKKTSDSTYGSYTTLQDNVTTTLTLDNTYAWDVQVLLQDKLGSTTYNLTIDRGIPIAFFDRLKRSLGINCFPDDQESLEVDGDNILTRIAGYGTTCKRATTNDWNTACGEASGFYMGADMNNSPNGSTVAGWWWVIHLAHNNLYQRQIAFSFLNNSQMFTRIMNNGTWNNWTLVNQAMVTADSNAVATGRYVDGKPEYVKRITTSIASSTNKAVSTGLTAGTHEITDLKGYITNNSATGIKVKDGFYSGSGNSFMIHVIGGTNIQVITGSNTSWITADDVCILEVYYINIS
jgi:hypothetical protein